MFRAPRPTPHRLLTEAAEILAVSTKTVRRSIAASDLDAVGLGRRTIRVRAESIERLVEARPINAWRDKLA